MAKVSVENAEEPGDVESDPNLQLRTRDATGKSFGKPL
jgi:hypothetical protein